MDDFFAPPAFKPAEALVQLKRQLRELRPLAERGNGFELRGQAVVELSADGQALQARLVKRPARSPEWTQHTLKNSADVRRFVDTVKAQLARWSDE
ncbi:MAG: hypothetical protein ACOZJZ_08360 [Pseudomonadota bacterium]